MLERKFPVEVPAKLVSVLRSEMSDRPTGADEEPGLRKPLSLTRRASLGVVLPRASRETLEARLRVEPELVRGTELERKLEL